MLVMLGTRRASPCRSASRFLCRGAATVTIKRKERALPSVRALAPIGGAAALVLRLSHRSFPSFLARSLPQSGKSREVRGAHRRRSEIEFIFQVRIKRGRRRRKEAPKNKSLSPSFSRGSKGQKRGRCANCKGKKLRTLKRSRGEKRKKVGCLASGKGRAKRSGKGKEREREREEDYRNISSRTPPPSP